MKTCYMSGEAIASLITAKHDQGIYDLVNVTISAIDLARMTFTLKLDDDHFVQCPLKSAYVDEVLEAFNGYPTKTVTGSILRRFYRNWPVRVYEEFPP